MVELGSPKASSPFLLAPGTLSLGSLWARLSAVSPIKRDLCMREERRGGRRPSSGTQRATQFCLGKGRRQKDFKERGGIKRTSVFRGSPLGPGGHFPTKWMMTSAYFFARVLCRTNSFFLFVAVCGQKASSHEGEEQRSLFLVSYTHTQVQLLPL